MDPSPGILEGMILSLTMDIYLYLSIYVCADTKQVEGIYTLTLNRLSVLLFVSAWNVVSRGLVMV